MALSSPLACAHRSVTSRPLLERCASSLQLVVDCVVIERFSFRVGSGRVARGVEAPPPSDAPADSLVIPGAIPGVAWPLDRAELHSSAGGNRGSPQGRRGVRR